MRNRGQIQARGDNRWLVRVYLGKDGAGKRKYSSQVIDGTFKQAEKLLTQKLREMDTETFVAPSKTTVGAFMAQWMESKQNISSRSKWVYQERIRQDIIPALGTVLLSQLGHARIQALYADLVKRGLSPATIRMTHSILRQAMNTAVKWNLLLRNPCQFVELPKLLKTTRTVLTIEQVQRVLAATRGTDQGVLWETLLVTGMRPGEALGLQWGDLNEDSAARSGASITISRSLHDDVHTGVRELGETKTSGSRRTIGIPEESARRLREYRIRRGAEGFNVMQNGLVFSDKHGDLLRINTVSGQWKAACKAAEVPIVRLYDTRHTHLTHLLMAGVNPKVAAERAGHSSVNLTLNTYSHILPETRKETAETVGKLLFRAVR